MTESGNPRNPILILGGGPIGMTCALLLARQGWSCEIFDARPVQALEGDRRLLALSRSSWLALEGLLGARFAPAAPIERVHVSSRGEPGAVELGARDFGASAVGATVWFGDLAAALGRACTQHPGIRMQRPRRIERVAQHPGGVRIFLDDATQVEGILAIDAEGTPPRMREAKSHALLAELELAGVRAGDAFERFTREGPLALLPIPQASAPSPGRRMSMIWCLPTVVARERALLGDADLRLHIAQALGPRLGSPVSIGPRALFALHTHRIERIWEHRLVHLGNAAQTLHPVAGQGFNLGIRDCICLRDAIVRAARQSGQDPIGARDTYLRARRMDRHAMPGLTAALPAVFEPSFVPLAVARSAALLALDAIPALRRPFTRLLMFGTPR